MTIGVVVIGRNEGERLRTCLRSVVGGADQVVYVDSNSSDDSVAMARALGCDVVELDMSLPFSAARARNQGFARIRELSPNVTYVQFVDGDCEVNADWLGLASRFLDENPQVAAVCGRRRERHPEQSVYNLLCDIEWDTPVGEAKSCGGDVMMRAQALAEANGYRAELIAGEEPELCVRLRAAGWHIWRLGNEMTLHDAAMTRFGQWWKRSKRAGYAFGEGARLHGAPPERHYVPHARRALVWGILLPAATVLLSLTNNLFLTLLLAYPAQIVRLVAKGKLTGSTAWWRAVFLVLGRFPEAHGLISFYYHRGIGRRGVLIEYK